jgi:8-oxo-dGTP pyrophosphatase MutT (NUDIX family)
MSYDGVIVIFYYISKISGDYKLLIANESSYFKESSNLSEQDKKDIEAKEKIPVESEKEDIRKVRKAFTERAKELEKKHGIHIKYDNILKEKDEKDEKEIYKVNFRVENDIYGVVKGKIEPRETPEDAAIRETREEIYLDIRGRPIEYIGDVTVYSNKSKVFIYKFPDELIVPRLNRQGELFNFRYESLQNLNDKFLHRFFNAKSEQAIKRFREKKYKNNSKPSDSKSWKKVGGTRKKRATRKNRGKGGKSRKGHRTYKRKH